MTKCKFISGIFLASFVLTLLVFPLAAFAQGKGRAKIASPRSKVARQHMSIVAAKVEELLTTRGLQGGIGEQVREIVKQQQQAQTQTQEQLNKLDSRKGFLKKLIGPNYKALGNLERQVERNQERVRQLEQLRNQLANWSDQTQVAEAIQVLTEQNTALQEVMVEEEQVSSLLGWLFRLLAR